MSIPDSRRRFLTLAGIFGLGALVDPKAVSAGLFYRRRACRPLRRGCAVKVDSGVKSPNCTDTGLSSWGDAGKTYTYENVYHIVLTGTFPTYRSYSVDMSDWFGAGVWTPRTRPMPTMLTGNVGSQLEFDAQLTEPGLPHVTSSLLNFTVTADATNCVWAMLPQILLYTK